MRGLAAQVAPQRQPLLGGGGVGRGQRDGQDRVGSQARLVRRAVEADQRPVERCLGRGVLPVQRLGDLPVDVLDRLADALAAPAVPAVAQLGGLETRRWRRPREPRRGPTPPSARSPRPRPSGCPAVEDLAGVDVLDLAHRRAGNLAEARPEAVSRGPQRQLGIDVELARDGHQARTEHRPARGSAPRGCRPRSPRRAPPPPRGPSPSPRAHPRSQSRPRPPGAGACARTAARAGSPEPRRTGPARGRARRLDPVPVAQHLTARSTPRPRRTRAGGGGSASRCSARRPAARSPCLAPPAAAQRKWTWNSTSPSSSSSLASSPPLGRVGQFVGLLDRVRDDRALVLLAVPRALAPQACA